MTREIKVVLLSGDRFAVASPYNPDFVEAARALGGKFLTVNFPRGPVSIADPAKLYTPISALPEKCWSFPCASAELVRERLLAIYGDDGFTSQRVRVRITPAAVEVRGSSWWFAGREVATRFDRDGRVRCQAAVVGGSFAASGGSRNNPCVTGSDDLLLEVADVPEALARKLATEKPKAVLIIEDAPTEKPETL